MSVEEWTGTASSEQMQAAVVVRKAPPPLGHVRGALVAAWRPSLRGTTARALLTVVALVLGLVSLLGATGAGIGPWGLITALPVAYFVSLGLLALSFLLNISSPRFSVPLAVVQALCLTILLDTAPEIIEAIPRFATSWLHAGFTDFIAHTGRAAVNVDARFSWPSFFAGSAILSKGAGLPSATYFLRWWPVCIDALYLLPLWAIAVRLLPTRRHAALVLFLFPLLNWVGQDYYSPQSVGFLLYLVFVTIVLYAFPGDAGAGQPVQAAWLDGEADDRTTELRRVAMLVALVLLSLAMATGHQLTPIVAALALIGLVLLRRTSLRAFSPLVLLITVGWICYGAVAFWSGHTGQVFGGLGHIWSNIYRDLVERVAGSTAHVDITTLRSALAAVSWLTALGGFFIARRANVDRWIPAILTVAAVPVLGGQSYGGEALLRVYLMSLPGVVVLLSVVLLRRAPTVRILLLTATLGLLIPTFLLARWGNESFEQVKAPEISAMRWVYRHVPAHATLVSLSPQIAWEFADVTKYQYETRLDEFAYQDAYTLELAFGAQRRGYVIITDSEVQYGIQDYGLRPDWATLVREKMAGSELFRLIYRNPDAWVYYYSRSGVGHGH